MYLEPGIVSDLHLLENFVIDRIDQDGAFASVYIRKQDSTPIIADITEIELQMRETGERRWEIIWSPFLSEFLKDTAGNTAGSGRLLRSKSAANEASAVGSMLLLVTCAIAYEIPDDVAAMGPDGTDCIDQALVNAFSGGKARSGYKFTYAPSNPKGEIYTDFLITATPSDCGKTGVRTYFADASGVLRFENDEGSGCPQATASSKPR